MGSTKTILKRATAYALAFVMAFSMMFTGSNTATVSAAKPVTKITVTNEPVMIQPGNTKMIKVTVKGGNKKFTAKSSKKKVAIVKVVGKKVKITAKKVGKTTITVTTKGKNKKGKKLKAKIAVTVLTKKDQAAVTSAKNAINNLPASTAVTVADEAKITEARKAYEAVQAKYKALVSEDVVKKLTDAEAALATAKKTAEEAAKKAVEDKTAADSVATKLNGLPVATAVKTADEADIVAARKAYDALTADQKALVSADVKKLTDAEAALAQAKKAEEDAKKAEESKLEKITVSASPTSITEKGGQADITVTPSPAGITLASVTYASSNEQFATVNSDGKVTGVNPGDVIIKVTAKDAAGNTAEGSVNIKVTEANAIGAKISFDAKDQTATLAVGGTKKLSPIVTAKEGVEVDKLKVVWETSSSRVATVTDGTVTAVGVGSATITATVEGTNAKATATITVSAENPSISSVTATHADVITVRMSVPVASEDRDKVLVSLKNGDKAISSFEVEWAEDGSAFNLKNNADYSAGTYNVEISADGDDVALGDKKTGSVEIESREITKIDITSDIIPYHTRVKVKFEVYDQYNDVMNNITANQFDWVVSAPGNTAITGVEYAVLSTRNAGYIEINSKLEGLEPGSNKNRNADKLRISATIKDNESQVKTTKDVAVFNLAVQTVTITGTTKTQIYEDKENPQNVEFTCVAKDSEGGDVDFQMVKWEAYTQPLTYKSYSPDIVGEPYISDDGKLIATVFAGKSGQATIQVAGADQDINSDSSKYTFDILAAPYANEIVLGDNNKTGEYSIIAGEFVDIPVSFIDQYGEDMEQGVVKSSSEFKKLFAVIATGVGEDITADDVTYISDEEGDYIHVDASRVKDGNQKVYLTFVSTTSNKRSPENPYQINITPPRAPKNIVIKTAPKSSIMVGESTTIEFEIKDNYDVNWTRSYGYKVVCKAKTDKFIEISDPIIDKNEGTGKVTITGSSSTSANEAVQTVELMLRNYNDTADLMTQPITYDINVENNLGGFKVTTDKTAYTAGQDVEITLTAYGKQLDNTEAKKLPDYDESFENILITVSNGGDSDKTYVNINFVNGVAKFKVKASKAGEGITYNGSVTSNGNVIPTEFVTSPVKIEVGAVEKFGIDVEDEKLTISYLDKMGNVVTSMAGLKTPVITVKTDNGTGKTATAEYIDELAADSKKAVNFEDGVATIQLKKPIPAGYKITVTLDAVTGEETTVAKQ